MQKNKKYGNHSFFPELESNDEMYPIENQNPDENFDENFTADYDDDYDDMEYFDYPTLADVLNEYLDTEFDEDPDDLAFIGF